MVDYKSNHTAVLTDVTDAELSRQPTSNNHDERSEPGGWTIILVLAGVTSCLGSAVPAGFNIGVVNNAVHLITRFCNESIRERYDVDISDNGLRVIWSVVVSIFLIGGVTGSFLASWLADRYGRKKTLYIGNIFGIIGAVMFFLVRLLNSIELLLVGRLIVGLSGGVATCVVPMYMAEIAPLRLRGAVGVLCQLGLTCGVFLGQIAGLDTVLGTETSWPFMLGLFIPLCVCALVLTIVVLPESPKYLFIIREQKQKALDELRRIRNMDTMLLQTEISNLNQEIEKKTTSEPWTIKRIMMDPSLRLPLFLVCLIQFGQQMSGINVIFYYSNSIFHDAGLGTAGAQYATLGTGVINIVMALVSVPVMSSLNRRCVFLSSNYLCFGCLVILCISIQLIRVSSCMPFVCIVSILAYVLFYGIGLGPIPYFIGSELFDVGPRPIAMALGSVFNWGGNFLVGMMFPIIDLIIGAYTFLIFAGFLLILGQVIRIYLPETRGRSTMEIASSVSQGFKSRPNET
ncbi:solute carrier family 2, facilitated glucose transporter member 1-like isoform X2 [Hylaeus volcanicus]|uniref:solute carrier family 2, facilitated glucose transporter member 1-like isoform X2 n=1 Tax=Hylaeus volcanicus TaxID=313075 RepID=UPI0023B84127|nr:solute carrier family 2, facilitated glucose transporter member 1-like isoform X2 [Hylaeus volcanicus]XP_053983412.1 solute carrier family 2, facilitated glucose transporter member 1-like isoform X2 [Hylaeus volcanicus]